MLRSGVARTSARSLLDLMRDATRLEAWGPQVGFTRLAHYSGAISGKPEIACRPSSFETLGAQARAELLIRMKAEETRRMLQLERTRIRESSDDTESPSRLLR